MGGLGVYQINLDGILRRLSGTVQVGKSES